MSQYSFVELSHIRDHITRRSSTATKTVGDSRDFVCVAHEMSKLLVYAFMYDTDYIKMYRAYDVEN